MYKGQGIEGSMQYWAKEQVKEQIRKDKHLRRIRAKLKEKRRRT